MSKHKSSRKKPGHKRSPHHHQQVPRTSVFSRLTGKQRTLGIALLVAGFCIIAVIIIFGGDDVSVAELQRSGRDNFMLGRFNDAITNYHRALNEEPNNTNLQHERFLVEQKAQFHGTGRSDMAIAAAQRVENTGEYPLMGSVALAQIYQQTGLAEEAKAVALNARASAVRFSDSAAQIALDEVLASLYRSKAQFDSAFYYSRDALQLASALEDTFHSAISRVVAGAAAIKLDSVDFALRTFHDLKDYRGVSESELRPVALIGLADIFQLTGQNDSALYYLDQVSDRYAPGAGDATAAYALFILARTNCGLEQFEDAETYFQRSLAIARDLNNVADAIDVMNEMADCYRQAHDWFNARKYYMAAGNLARKFEFEEKDQYTADLNVRFLRELPAADYKRAGEEGLALAEGFTEGA